MGAAEKNEMVELNENKNNSKILAADKKGPSNKRAGGTNDEIRKDTTNAQPMGLDPNNT